MSIQGLCLVDLSSVSSYWSSYMVEMEIAKLRNLMGARPSGALTLWEEFERMSLEVVSVTASQVSASQQLEESASSAARTAV